MNDEKILIIVDMINGFINNGNLADNGINRITSTIEELVLKYKKNRHKIIAFKDVHEISSLEFKNFPVHCLKDTDEVELVDELKRYENDFIVFEKNSTSGFVLNEFRDLIDSLTDLKEVVITGCCSDICILNLAIPLKNYFNQQNKNVDIIVPKNAVETYNIPNVHERKQWNDMAFKFMLQAGVKIVSNI